MTHTDRAVSDLLTENTALRAALEATGAKLDRAKRANTVLLWACAVVGLIAVYGWLVLWLGRL